MPREQQRGDGIYTTEPHVSVAESPSGAPSRPSRTRARAEPRAQASEGDGFGIFSEAQMGLLVPILAETQHLAEKQLKAAIVALREEVEVTVAVCRDEMLGKIDARNFGAAILDETSEIAKRAVHELRRDLDERAKIVKARLDVLNERLDAFERDAKRREVEAWKGAMAQIVRNFGKLGAVEAKLDALTQAVRDLYEGLGEQPPRALLPLALPPPAA